MGANICDRALAHFVIGRHIAVGTLPPAISGPRRGCVGQVQLLLVPQQQVSPREASRTLWTLEWLLFGVRPLMSLQVLQSRERSPACSTDVRAWLVRLGRWKIATRWRSGGRHRLSIGLRTRRWCWSSGQCAAMQSDCCGLPTIGAHSRSAVRLRLVRGLGFCVRVRLGGGLGLHTLGCPEDEGRRERGEERSRCERRASAGSRQCRSATISRLVM